MGGSVLFVYEGGFVDERRVLAEARAVVGAASLIGVWFVLCRVGDGLYDVANGSVMKWRLPLSLVFSGSRFNKVEPGSNGRSVSARTTSRPSAGEDRVQLGCRVDGPKPIRVVCDTCRWDRHCPAERLDRLIRSRGGQSQRASQVQRSGTLRPTPPRCATAYARLLVVSRRSNGRVVHGSRRRGGSAIPHACSVLDEGARRGCWVARVIAPKRECDHRRDVPPEDWTKALLGRGRERRACTPRGPLPGAASRRRRCRSWPRASRG